MRRRHKEPGQRSSKEAVSHRPSDRRVNTAHRFPPDRVAGTAHRVLRALGGSIRNVRCAVHNAQSPVRVIGLLIAVVVLASSADFATARAPRDAGDRAGGPQTAVGQRSALPLPMRPSLPLQLDAIPTLRVSLGGGSQWVDPEGSGHGARGGDCSGTVVVAHTDADFTGGDLMIQAGFAEDEIAAASYVLSPDAFPIQIKVMECVFAQANAIEPTLTAWSVLIWDGLPSTGILVAQFSSDGKILPHLLLDPGTQAANIMVIVDPEDPEQIFILNDSGTNTFTIGFRVDRHNHQVDDPCVIPPPSNRNAFPTTDVSGLESLDGNWLYAIDCPPPSCPSGWNPFAQLGLCQPTGDWLLRATYSTAAPACEGACCEQDGGCLDNVSSETCDALGGTFMGTQTECAEITCPEPAGACCLGLTCLTDVTAEQCAAVSGLYIGDGTTCDDDPCAPGACCMPDGSCRHLIATQCQSEGGAFQGIDTDCGSVECPQPTGSCCIGLVCIPAQTQETCEEVGTWNGPESTCDPDPCPVQGCAPTVLALLGDPCFGIGDQVEVAVAMSNACEPILAGQFFLAYSTTVLDFVSISPGDDPFILELGQFVDEEEGFIDYAVSVAPAQEGTMIDTVMARITFEVIGDQEIPFVVWRDEQPPLWPSCGTDFVDAGREDDVDVTDFAGFQRCFTGDGTPASDCCRLWFDDDADEDVDSLDYAVFHASFTGPTLWVCDG